MMILVLLMQTATASHAMEHLDTGHTEQCLVYSSGDQEQRHHASFIKDLTPAPGRRFELGVRLQF